MKMIAVSTQMFDRDLLARPHLAALRDAGFGAVEVFASPGHFEWEDGAYVARIARDLRELGLAVFSAHAPWAPGQDISAADGAQRAASLQSVRRAVDALVAMGGQVLVLHPGATLTDPGRKAELLDVAAESTEGVAAYCRARGVRVALENPPPYELGGDNADMLALYRRLAGDPTIAACFDTGHAHVSAEGIDFLRDIPQEVVLVHISDNHGAQDEHLAPGDGTLPWARLWPLLRARHFDGCLMLELSGVSDATATLARGVAWLREAMAQIS